MASPNTIRIQIDRERRKQALLGEYIHVSAAMVPNPLGGYSRPAGVPGDTYRCRQGQLRGKAKIKALKRRRHQA